MANRSETEIAIVGAGFTGLLCAAHLQRLMPEAKIYLCEATVNWARGIAYSTRCADHLLNVPAQAMSAFPDEPNHFLSWARKRLPSASPEDFLPRKFYGDYLEDIFEAVAARPGFTKVQKEITSLQLQGSKIALKSEAEKICQVDAVILAFGNFAPQTLSVFSPEIENDPMYISNPWTTDKYKDLAALNSVLVVGSGLTAVDFILEAERAGFRGTFYLISRHGHLPHVHAVNPLQPPLSTFPGPQDSARKMLHALRDCARNSSADWRSLMDALRPHVQSYWRAFSFREQDRFLRHLRSYWDIHRHRMAPAVADKINQIRNSGRLQVQAGRLRRVSREHNRTFLVSYTARKGALCTLETDAIVNCTGAAGTIRSFQSQVLQHLISTGVACPDRRNAGIQTAANTAVIDAQGSARNGIFAPGLLRKGELWESIAVRELREQAVVAARAVQNYLEEKNDDVA